MEPTESYRESHNYQYIPIQCNVLRDKEESGKEGSARVSSYRSTNPGR